MSADHYTNPNDSLGYGIPNFAMALDILQEMTSSLTEFTSDGLSLYPNPAGASVELQLLGTWDPRSIEIHMFDMQGRAINVRSSLIGTNKLSFDLVGLASGAYVIRVIEKERSAQRIFTKQ